MIKRLLHRFYALPYESQIILLICSFGAVRLLVEMVLDLVNELNYSGLVLDVVLLGLLISFLYTGIKKSFSNISVLFGMVISILLAYNFIRYGGASGFSKYNYYAGLYMITMVYTHRQLYRMVGFNLGLLALILIIDQAAPQWLEWSRVDSPVRTDAFWLTLIMLAFFTYYLKELTISQGKKLSALNDTMAEQIREVRKNNRMLEASNLKLKEVQTDLEREVNRRSEILQRKTQSIENFIHVNSSDLIGAVDNLLKSMEHVESDSRYNDYWRNAGRELLTVVQSIRNNLNKDILLNRKSVRPHENTH
jgi:hypothetical protein